MANWPQTAEFIAEQLRGTCDSMSVVLERYDMEAAEDDIDFCQEIDALVFCCETCGWWCEQSEMADNDDDDWVCDQCESGDDEED